ncbi:MAG: hypothetical protein ABI747_03480 [Candidatus Moraniibacteriota bacterium]
MSLILHLFLHVAFAFLAGFIAWILIPVSPWIPFVAAFFGGVLIDLDHFIDYFMAFGIRFNLKAFIEGHHFLKNDKIYVLFHGWEYTILLAGGAWFFRTDTGLQAAFFALSLGMLLHLLVDVIVNHGMTIRGYSAFYRAKHDYAMEKIVTPEHYAKDVMKKRALMMNEK